MPSLLHKAPVRCRHKGTYITASAINDSKRLRSTISTTGDMDKSSTDLYNTSSRLLSTNNHLNNKHIIAKLDTNPYDKSNVNLGLNSIAITRNVISSASTTTTPYTNNVVTKNATMSTSAPSIASSTSIRRTHSTKIQNSQKETSTSMDDEYGAMESTGKVYVHPAPYRLESFGMFGHYNTKYGDSIKAAPSKLPRGTIDPAFVNYNTYGNLNAARDNVVVICHALTGNSSLEAWWGQLLGPGKAFDTDRYFVVCCNILGSCYGSCGPSSSRPGFEGDDDDVPRDKSGRPIYGIDFPDVSVRDTVRLQLLLLRNELKINSVKCVIGGSFGGMQVMEYCVMAGATRPVGVVENMGGMMNTGSNGGGGSGANTLMGSEMMMRKNDLGGVPYGIGEFVSKRNGRIEPFVRSAVPIACGAAHTAWQIVSGDIWMRWVFACTREHIRQSLTSQPQL